MVHGGNPRGSGKRRQVDPVCAPHSPAVGAGWIQGTAQERRRKLWL
nr:MAG TPA: hypothetical protein [Caudoviricetes sp.]